MKTGFCAAQIKGLWPLIDVALCDLVTESRTRLCHAFFNYQEEVMKNEGIVDRSIRVVVGLILLSLVFVGPQTLWGLVGLVPLITGLVGFCPLYKVIGLNSCPISRK